MLFNAAIFSSLLLAPVVLAVPSGLSTPIARRHDSLYTRTRVNNLERAVDSTGSIQYTGGWAGAMWVEGNGTFDTVTGTFTVPTPSGPDGASGGIWIAIDGWESDCPNINVETGIVFTANSNGPTYLGYCERYPNDVVTLSDFSIHAGDVLRLTIDSSSPTNATSTIENLTDGQYVSCNLESSFSLCGGSVGWIVQVENFVGNELADFGTVTFTNASASGNSSGTIYTPDGAQIFDIEQNTTVLTNVSTSGDTVTIGYIPTSN